MIVGRVFVSGLATNETTTRQRTSQDSYLHFWLPACDDLHLGRAQQQRCLPAGNQFASILVEALVPWQGCFLSTVESFADRCVSVIVRLTTEVSDRLQGRAFVQQDIVLRLTMRIVVDTKVEVVRQILDLQ